MTKISTKHFLLTSIMAVVMLTCMFQTLQANTNGLNDDWKEYDPVGVLGLPPEDDGLIQINAVDYNYTEAGSWSDAGTVQSVVVEEEEETVYAYLADGPNGLRILNVTDPANPYEVGSYNPGGAFAYDVVLQGDYIYLSYGTEGLVILDKANKFSPTLVGQEKDFLNGNESRGMDIDENYVYLACGLGGMAMIAIADPSDPDYLSSYTDGYFARDVAQGGAYAFITYQNHGLTVAQVGNPLVIVRYGNYSTGDYYGITVEFETYTRYAYIGSKDGLVVMNLWDVQNPGIKADASRIESEKKVLDTYKVGSRVFASYENYGMKIYNMSDVYVPLNDGVSGTYNDGGIGTSITVYNNVAYLVDQTDGLEIIELDPDKDNLYSGDEVNVYLTDPFDDDSDDDQIDDGEEIFVYLTDPLNPDSDTDNVIDGDEILTYFTNPLLNDTDDDGLYDDEEIYGVYYFGSPLANGTGYIFPDPLDADTDSDHLDDGVEYNIYGTDPMTNDTDGDGMWDNYEIINTLNATYDDSLEDKDTDGLTNYAEFLINTNPSNNDSDSDLLTDGEEIFGYFNDTHTYSNSTGYITTNNPLNADSDLDGLFDGWEVLYYDTDPLTWDSDGDGLNDYIEVMLAHTNPNSNDTDGDLLLDDWEYNSGTDPLIPDADADPDGDGLTNIEEFLNDTDPRDSDSDNDGMDDGWEIEYGLNPLVKDNHLDKDSDGLNNLTEYQIGTNPTLKDTDSDGMDDFWEHDYGTDPLIDDADIDAELADEGGPDGLTNIQEFNVGTDPHNADTDGDDLSDGDEVNIYFTNPLKADTDGDGYSDGEEIAAGTDPLDAKSNPRQLLILRVTTISVSIALAIIIGLALFLTFFWYLSPEQRLFRVVSKQRAEGLESISLKEATILIDKKLNKGQIKQIVNEYSNSKNITLHNNRIWFSNDIRMRENFGLIKEKIDSFEGRPIKGKNLTEITARITKNKTLAEKLGYREIVDKFTELEEFLDTVKVGKVIKKTPPADVLPDVDEKDFSSETVVDADTLFESEPSEDVVPDEIDEESDIDSPED